MVPEDRWLSQSEASSVHQFRPGAGSPVVDSNLSVKRPLTSPPHTVTVTMDASMDASMEGWGGHAQGSGLHSVLFHMLWDPEEM